MLISARAADEKEIGGGVAHRICNALRVVGDMERADDPSRAQRHRPFRLCRGTLTRTCRSLKPRSHCIVMIALYSLPMTHQGLGEFEQMVLLAIAHLHG